MSEGATLDSARVLALFEELSARLTEAGVSAQLFVVGGAAMAIAYDGGRVTRDAAVLFNELEYASAQDCIDLLTRTYPISQLLPRHRYLAEEVAVRAANVRH